MIKSWWNCDRTRLDRIVMESRSRTSWIVIMDAAIPSLWNRDCESVAVRDHDSVANSQLRCGFAIAIPPPITLIAALPSRNFYVSMSVPLGMVKFTCFKRHRSVFKTLHYIIPIVNQNPHSMIFLYMIEKGYLTQRRTLIIFPI